MAANTGGESARGWHSHDTVPDGVNRAMVLPLPIIV